MEHICNFILAHAHAQIHKQLNMLLYSQMNGQKSSYQTQSGFKQKSASFTRQISNQKHARACVIAARSARCAEATDLTIW